MMDLNLTIDHANQKYPFCIVWTPIPIITWVFPILGHIGIATSSGVIHHFATSYLVSENDGAYGHPTKYWQLKYHLACGWQLGWDSAVTEANAEYSSRKHILCCDNCYSHVAMALNVMKYDGQTNWNTAKLIIFMMLKSRYVSVRSILRTWTPFVIVIAIISLIVFMIYDSLQHT